MSYYVSGTVLLGHSIEELGQLAKDTGQAAYRGKQLYDGLMHGARTIDNLNQARHLADDCIKISPPFILSVNGSD